MIPGTKISAAGPIKLRAFSNIDCQIRKCMVAMQELNVSEFVLSNELVSMALAMVAENPEVNDILSELFTPDGNELYVHPASRYLRRVTSRW